ncbi:uncharacterized protein B0P05DRAFT_547888 [Gilbertella persicaria]|uniref:uncharacterized protein n=1 Tax=Gilbertella persicaria TaxID=101096 RepID=UPI002220D2D1|nr:uncharacterized protein B0P05DRAFT_547888 [Gilbertella persicaria]KAI8074262.1 hypothetical protein B0P05DRAFT_547888 [Gilbertella persicaria]
MDVTNKSIALICVIVISYHHAFSMIFDVVAQENESCFDISRYCPGRTVLHEFNSQKCFYCQLKNVCNVMHTLIY